MNLNEFKNGITLVRKTYSLQRQNHFLLVQLENLPADGGY